MRRELKSQRASARAALERYQRAALAAELELPPELVQGETLEALEGSLEAARKAVARIRERLAASAEGAGFPVWAPARGGRAGGSMSTVVTGVPVSRAIASAQMVAGRRVAVAVFDPGQSVDAMVVGAY